MKLQQKDKLPIENKGLSASFPIVAIGASAGGLRAVIDVLKNLPEDTGMAFIYVQHLSREHKSMLSSILSRVTKMKVQEVVDMEKLAPNNVYVIPHNKGIEVTDGHIKLLPRLHSKEINLSVDVLFSSLAATHKENVIGIVLSGNATDGTEGLKAIKAAGGLAFAQDSSAQSGSMPESAISSGVVDLVLSPKAMAMELTRLSKSGFPLNVSKSKKKVASENGSAEVKAVLDIVHKETGIDFSHYKMASIKRRLHHRMMQSGTNSIEEYTKTLLSEKSEVSLLNNDLLINVTSFFRDADAFAYLKASVLSKILKKKKPGEMLRIWVPACSTGEEAYSIAMLIVELQENMPDKIPVKIFATDLSDKMIRDARAGEYPERSIKLVSKKRVKRFFTQSGDIYTVTKDIRQMCVFSPHNILHDPPFSRMDIISCCNLMIYFGPSAQKKVLSILHFALSEKGYLMLGKSETIGTASQFFIQVHNDFKIYSRKKNKVIRKTAELIPRLSRTSVYGKAAKSGETKSVIPFSKLDSTIDSALLAHFMPACAIINKDMEILQFRGSTTLYLTHPQGKASLNILKMTRPECALELRSAIHEAIKTNTSILKSGIEVNIGSTFRMMSLEVCPLKVEWEEPLLLVVFKLQEENTHISESSNTNGVTSKRDQALKKLTDELRNLRMEMSFIIESQESTFEDLQAANEEIVSTNEEFQALNEELETSKEEIEATNEEIIATNQELQLRNDLLQESYDYSEAIRDTIHEPVLILEAGLRIKYANKSFYKKFHCNKESTEGKLLFELSNNLWDIPALRDLLSNTIKKNINFENYKVKHDFPGIGEKTMLLNAHQIIQKQHREKLILLAIEDITELTTYYQKEQDALKKDIYLHKIDKAKLERAVALRTKQLTRKNCELESANKDLTSFTYVSSHDLQEPLRKIQTFISYINGTEMSNLSEQGKSYLTKVSDTATRMRNLLDDLLIYSRTKNAEQVFEETDLNTIFEKGLQDFDELIIKKKAKINVENLCHANIIRSQFERVLYNLLSNSLKFSKARTAPVITIRSEVVKGVDVKELKLSPKINYCHLIYSDNGIGFDPKYKDRIFEVFQRLHSVNEYEGTGMGLAICKMIIENHHGRITATGKLKKGAQFDIYIPAA
jgi:two-component system CheB/CheR fusion protein